MLDNGQANDKEKSKMILRQRNITATIVGTGLLPPPPSEARERARIDAKAAVFQSNTGLGIVLLVLISLIEGALQAQQFIHYGDYVQGSLDTTGQVNSYTFDGAAGDVLFIRMVDVNIVNLPELSLYAPNGSCRATASSEDQVELDTVRLDSTGQYTLLVTDANGAASGGYGMYLQRCFSPGRAMYILYDANIEDTIRDNGSVCAYTFDATAGQVVNIRMVDVNIVNLPELSLYAPNGSWLECASSEDQVQLSEVHLASSGEYTILATDADGAASGAYTLSLMQVGGTLARDVAVTRILAPSGTIDSGASFVPKAWVVSYGSLVATFPVILRCGSFYEDSLMVDSLLPDDSTLVAFDTLRLIRPDTQVLQCTTALVGDEQPGNNALTDTFFVRYQDVGEDSIVAPRNTLDSTSVTPVVRVINYGNDSATFPVWFIISTSSGQQLAAGSPRPTAYGSGLMASEPRVNTGEYCVNPSSSVVSVPLTAAGHQPLATVSEPGATGDEPRLTSNEIRATSDEPLAASRGDSVVYQDSIWLTLAPGGRVYRAFRLWVAYPADTYRLESFTDFANDANRGNDSLQGMLVISPKLGIEEPAASQLLPKAFELTGSAPNPFLRMAVIRYALPFECRVVLKIFNPSGALVRTLRSAQEEPGFRQVSWDGRDDFGRTVGKGLYFCRLEAGAFSATRKLVKTNN
jgi:hypothetical protein